MTGSQRRLSVWSVLSAVLAIGLCPVVTILAIPAGIMALRETGPHRKAGRRLAIIAITLACVVTPLTTWASVWWNANVREPLLEGPVLAIQAGQAGDVSAFLAGMSDDAVDPPESARVFLHALTGSLGVLRSMRPAQEVQGDETAEASRRGAGSWTIWVPYEAMFDQGAAMVQARFVVGDDRGWITSFDALEITLDDGTVLTWPDDVGGGGPE